MAAAHGVLDFEVRGLENARCVSQTLAAALVRCFGNAVTLGSPLLASAAPVYMRTCGEKRLGPGLGAREEPQVSPCTRTSFQPAWNALASPKTLTGNGRAGQHIGSGFGVLVYVAVCVCVCMCIG